MSGEFQVIWPVGPNQSTSIDGGYGFTSAQDYGDRVISGESSFHHGLDFGTGGRSSLRVEAVADGVVVSSVSGEPTYGNLVKIRHTGDLEGWVTWYGHLASKSTLAANDPINQGDFIANMGESGVAQGVHLHLGAYYDGDEKDPEPFIRNRIDLPTGDTVPDIISTDYAVNQRLTGSYVPVAIDQGLSIIAAQYRVINAIVTIHVSDFVAGQRVFGQFGRHVEGAPNDIALYDPVEFFPSGGVTSNGQMSINVALTASQRLRFLAKGSGGSVLPNIDSIQVRAMAWRHPS